MNPSLSSSPYLWTALGAFFWGLALGQALRWAAVYVPARRSLRRGEELPPLRPGRLVRASSFASLGILALVALLVLPAKTSLADGRLLAWTLFFSGAGLLAGLLPRLGSLLVLLVLTAAILVLRLGCVGFRSYVGEEEIARLLPLGFAGGGTAPTRFTAEFREEDGPSSLPPRRVELPQTGASLLVEALVLRGPLAFLEAFPAEAGELRLFRLVGFGGGSATTLLFERKASLLDRAAPLDLAALPQPGAPPAVRSLLAGLLERRLAQSELPAITLLQPVVYAIDSELAPRLPAPAGDAFGVLSR